MALISYSLNVSSFRFDQLLPSVSQSNARLGQQKVEAEEEKGTTKVHLKELSQERDQLKGKVRELSNKVDQLSQSIHECKSTERQMEQRVKQLEVRNDKSLKRSRARSDSRSSLIRFLSHRSNYF